MRALTLALALTLLPVSPTSAAPITVTFPGVFTFINDPNGGLGPDFQVGAEFWVSYTIDPDRVLELRCGSGSPPSSCTYEGSPPDSLHALLGVGDTTLAGVSEVEVINDGGGGSTPVGMTWDVYLGYLKKMVESFRAPLERIELSAASANLDMLEIWALRPGSEPFVAAYPGSDAFNPSSPSARRDPDRVRGITDVLRDVHDDLKGE